MNIGHNNKKIIQEIGNGKKDHFDELNNSDELSDQQQMQINILQKIVKTRLINKNNIFFTNINIISLGENCIGRVIPTRWGIIKTKEFGRLSMPFDLAVHFGESLCRILDDEFEEYSKCENLFYEKDWRCWKNLKYRVTYNHDTDLGVDDIDKLSKRYRDRVENFINVLKNGKKTFFIYSMFKSDFSDFNLLIKMLHKYNNNFHIIILNHRALEITNSNPMITVIDCPFPSNDYIWHDATHYATQAGFEFENNIIDNMINIIQNKT
ncbi:MAG: DUF1796 family putative cysteine peptidase [Sulfuricurvum sp.]|uniref:DUF1796 family putative cysteine peptidase n=1 Tax=Sulfuricurvum sp. TaxID=2025608 RepID=UPI002634EDF8|nr:DUF1796 family putative cysteine peptidase [Sulfuricurvum sp.]MDD2828447.1 DUF1796 family putative cysteine peptidase [Sulfuricurvum sp.]MDD4949452.1 DUF1796 family putative cysteine peptidase [Sulfuricurvum sp.]